MPASNNQTRIVSFYRPKNGTLEFFKNEIFSKRGSFNYATEYWRNKYGEGSYTVIGGGLWA